MAITQAITNSFRLELFQAIHNFVSHTFKLALYTEDASLSGITEVYSSTGEVAGAGYVAGGQALTVAAVTILNNVALIDFLDVSFAATLTEVRGGLIYNSSAANRSVMVLDFGIERASVAGIFTVTFPIADAQNAIIRLE